MQPERSRPVAARRVARRLAAPGSVHPARRALARRANALSQRRSLPARAAAGRAGVVVVAVRAPVDDLAERGLTANRLIGLVLK
jgi:hypothetical protein